MVFPPDHPYHHSVIGSMEDLDAASLEDVERFFRTYYAPNNASLAIAGAVDAATVRRMVERYFGDIPGGADVPHVAAASGSIPEDRALVLEDDVELPRLYMAWHSPAFFDEGDAALDFVASVLADGKPSRLHRSLIYERRIAQDVQAFQNSGMLGSSFFVVDTGRQGISLAELEEGVRRELEAIVTRGIEERELERVRNQIETDFVDGLQNVLNRADRLNLYAYYTGDPGYVGEDLERYRRLRRADVVDAARRYLLQAPSVVLSAVPKGRRDLAAREAA